MSSRYYLEEDAEAEEPVPRIGRRPYDFVGTVVGLIGVGALFTPLFPAGLLLIGLAVVLRRKRWFCGGCGNRLEETSVLCPSCGVEVSRGRPMGGLEMVLRVAIWVVGLLSAAVVIAVLLV